MPKSVIEPVPATRERQSPGNFDSESVIAQKNVADSGNQNSRSSAADPIVVLAGGRGSTSSSVEEEAVARLPHQADIASRIVVDDDTNMNLAFVVLLDGFDNRRLARERDVHDVAACRDAAGRGFQALFRSPSARRKLRDRLLVF
jgi:hypothetical protein